MGWKEAEERRFYDNVRKEPNALLNSTRSWRTSEKRYIFHWILVRISVLRTIRVHRGEQVLASFLLYL